MEIKYKIEILETGQKHEFVLNFDDETYLYQPEVKENLPKWTELENGKCENRGLFPSPRFFLDCWAKHPREV